MGTPSDDRLKGRRMKREAFALWIVFYALIAAFGVFIAKAPRSGASRRHSMAADTASGIDKGSIDGSGPQLEHSLSQPAGAVSSPPGTEGDAGTASWSPTGDIPGGVYSQPFILEGLPTPEECVLATTLDLWNSEALKTLTLAEVRAWGVEMKGYDLTGDGLLLDRIGGLPTEEDVIDALDHPEVVDALNKFLVADGIALEFGMHAKKSPEMLEAHVNALRARDAAQDGLYQILDKASAYKHWALLGAVWRATDRE